MTLKAAVLAAVLAAMIFVPSTAAQTLPPLQPDLNVMGNWTCTGPQNRNVVRVNGTSSGMDAVNLRTNCSGRIGRLEITGIMADCVKINAPSPEAHDLLIESGHAFDSSTSSSHKDGVQAMGGDRITFRNFLFDCGTPSGGTGGGHWFPAGSNGGSPTFIVCDRCAFLPRMNNQIAVQSNTVSSGVRNSLVCRPNSGRQPFTPPAGNLGGNTVVANTDTLCTRAGAAAWLGDVPPPPPPPPGEDPVLTICANFTTNFTLCWPKLTGVTRFNFYVDGGTVSHSLNPNLERVRFGKQMGTHLYGVEAVYANGDAGYSEVAVTR